MDETMKTIFPLLLVGVPFFGVLAMVEVIPFWFTGLWVLLIVAGMFALMWELHRDLEKTP